MSHPVQCLKIRGGAKEGPVGAVAITVIAIAPPRNFQGLFLMCEYYIFISCLVSNAECHCNCAVKLVLCVCVCTCLYMCVGGVAVEIKLWRPAHYGGTLNFRAPSLKCRANQKREISAEDCSFWGGAACFFEDIWPELEARWSLSRHPAHSYGMAPCRAHEEWESGIKQAHQICLWGYNDPKGTSESYLSISLACYPSSAVFPIQVDGDPQTVHVFFQTIPVYTAIEE